MAATRFLGKATLLALSICAILSLHGAEAQNCTCDNSVVPRWGIAILVLVSIILCLCLLSCCLAPIMCRKRDDGCQTGFSMGK